jgi:hypothetical protein
MVETRIAPRFRAAKLARIEYDRETIDCVVRDLSATGSALEVANADLIPVKFELVLPEDGLSLPCRVVWRRGFRLGVTFEYSAFD